MDLYLYLCRMSEPKKRELLKKFKNLSNKRKNEILQLAELTYRSCALEGSTLTKEETFFLDKQHLEHVCSTI